MAHGVNTSLFIVVNWFAYKIIIKCKKYTVLYFVHALPFLVNISKWHNTVPLNHTRSSMHNTGFTSAIAKLHYRKDPHMHNSMRKTNTNPSPDHNQYRSRCPDPNASIHKFIHYMAIAAICDSGLCDSGLSPNTVHTGPYML